ncbi:glycosyltransferase [uncultured Paludibaculum sp.]|uniref:glycosyltransferase n=1 Tax=uncultured Paludibaculum sp. TaxID=1765020 RepID=UPI002AAC149F|nr:glycosyltransferase [uncultured Paludibaculum sp.]
MVAAELRLELESKEARLKELAAQVEQLQEMVVGQAGRMAVLRSDLQKAERIRRLTLKRCEQFEATFGSELTAYRGQRAWQLMLWCRKAYTLLRAAPGLKKLRLLWFAISSLFGRARVADQELTFPSLSDYLPMQLRTEFFHLAASQDTLADTVRLILPQPKKYDVVILGIIEFDFRFQRPQQLAVRFAEEGHRVFWVSPGRHVPPSCAEAYEMLDLRENLWEVRLRGRKSSIYEGTLDADRAKELLDGLSEFYRDAGIVESCVFIQLPFWRRLALGLRAAFGSAVLYDCMDDWETFPSIGPFNISEERLLAAESDVLVVTAQKLVEKFEEWGLKPLLVRNGADYESFAKAEVDPDLLRELQKPIVGYFGAIAEWMDLDLVYQVAVARPDYSFVLVGKVFNRDTSRLESLSNVHLLGHKEYSEIPAYLRTFDVCTIPFLVNQVTNATDPVKLYEYCSHGKPVVATALAELEALRDVVYIASDATEFAQMLDQALDEKTGEQARHRVEFAQANTWSHRSAVMDQAVARTFPLVSILVVTYNSAEFLAPCLDSILRNTAYANFEIVVVDNASRDATPSVARRYASDHGCVQAHCLGENLGFAGGNNEAAKHAGGEYLVFLNADTLVTTGWLEYLLRHCRQDGRVGLVTPVTNFVGNEAKVNVDYEDQMEMEEFAAALARGNQGRSFEIDVAALYCALVPRRVWEAAGGLDESFTIGMFEDDDFSMRVRAAGYRVIAAEDCFIHHFGQGSFSKLDADTYMRLFERNRKIFEDKWQTTWKAHQTRDGVRPAHEEERFEPGRFCRALTKVSQ